MAGKTWLPAVYVTTFIALAVQGAVPTVETCLGYVAENQPLACVCKPEGCTSEQSSLSWINLTTSSALYIPNITREDNGRQFVCQLNCGGAISTASFTLQVSYGPSAEKMSVSIDGDLPFTTNGSRMLNITCQATDVNPVPVYSWNDARCQNNSSTCSFVPKPEQDDGKTVRCRAFNPRNLRAAEKELVLNFTYPPVTAHMISPNSNTIVKAGDTLSCTVTGGKPLVQSVNFSCVNPYHPDQNDTVNITSVTSNLIVHTSQANDDNMTCHCSAYWAPVQGFYATSVSASFRTIYPPVTVPKISPDSTKVVKSGDTLSCTVTGGKPLVQSVHFSCDNPHHTDQADTVNSASVTSYITVNTSQAHDDNMACQCSAYWAPEPRYYTHSVSVSFRTEYPAKIKAFIMNEQNSTLTVNGTTDVRLFCEAHGLPSPNITLQGPHDDNLIGHLTRLNDTHSKTEHTIVAVTDTHMGNYTCIANNNVGKTADTSTFILNVNFPPRFNSSDGPGHSRDTAVNMSEQGIDLELRAYPAPDCFNFEDFTDNSHHTCEKISSDSGIFFATASQRGPGSPEVTCHIRPGHNVQKGWLYMVTISNRFGSVQYYFSVTGVPPFPVTTTLHGSKADVGGIVGGVVGGIIAIVVVVVVVVIVWKRKYRRYEKPQPKRDHDSSPYTGMQVMQGTDHRLSAHYENSPQNAAGPSPPNYTNMAAEPGNQPASTHYVNAQLKNPNISSSANYVNTEAHYDLAQGPGDYVNLETKTNYEQLQPRSETEANVYKTLNTSR